MHLLAPWWWLLFVPLAGALVLLYLLKLRRRNQLVSSIFLWAQAFQDLQANAPLQKLRRNLLLLLQLLALLLIVFALTRPALRWRQAGGRMIVLVIDASASMKATDVLPSRFAAAKRAAYGAVEALGNRDRMMIVAVGGGTQPLTTFTDDKRRLREALGHLQPTDARADLRGAIELAVGLTRGKKDAGAEMTILSDGGVPPLNLPADFSMPIHFERFGRRGENVGIVSMSARRRVSRQGGFEGLIALKNFGRASRRFTLEIFLDANLLDAREIELPAGAGRTELLNELPAASGVLRARLDLRDDLAVDNAAELMLPKAEPTAVTLATTGNLFLSTALSLDPTLKVTATTAVPAILPAGSVLVADMVPVALLPAGVSALLIGQTGGAAPGEVGAQVEQPKIVDWDRRHPVMTYVDLHGVRVTSAHVAVPGPGAEALIEADAGPIALASERDGRRIVYLGWDLHRSDFPLSAAFPTFIANCMSWLSGQRERAQAANVRTGDALPISVPPTVSEVTLRMPDGGSASYAVTGGVITLDRITRAGVYSLTGKGFSMRFAANLLDAGESQLTPRDLTAISGERERTVAARKSMPTEKELWRPLALLALLLLCLEWWVFHRRIG